MVEMSVCEDCVRLTGGRCWRHSSVVVTTGGPLIPQREPRVHDRREAMTDEEIVREVLKQQTWAEPQPALAALGRLIAQRDEAVKALRNIADGGWPGFDDSDPLGAAGLARAALNSFLRLQGSGICEGCDWPWDPEMHVYGSKACCPDCSHFDSPSQGGPVSEHQCDLPEIGGLTSAWTLPWECGICGRVFAPGVYGVWTEVRGPRSHPKEGA